MAEKLLMFALSPTMEEGTIAKWNKQEGDKIGSGDVICEVETDKATMDYESIQEGILLKIIVPAGKQARVGDMIGIIGASGEDYSSLLIPKAGSDIPPVALPKDVAATSQPVVQSGTASHTNSGGSAKASPLARKLASEQGIDLASLVGSGPGGRIVKRDLEAGSSASAGGSTAKPLYTAQARAEDLRIPVQGKRAVIAKRLAESMFSAPHFYLKKSAIADGVLAARAMLNKEVPASAKISFNAFIIKFVAEALKRFPAVNAGWQGDSILQFGSIDIALAVDLGNGLITPIVRDTGSKGIRQIDAELKILIEKAGNGTLKPDEYSGASFTISNLGSFGIEEFTAIINPPGAAILALGEVKKTPVVAEDDSITIAQVMKLTLSCDHRVIDGALGGKFLAELCNMLENPVRSLF